MNSKLKELKEKRNDLLMKADNILNKAAEETRALTEQEEKDYNQYTKDIEGLSNTIKLLEAQEERVLEDMPLEERQNEETKKEERRAFERFCRGEARALDVGTNGALLPRTVAAEIIGLINDYVPYMDICDTYNVRGDFSLPYYDETESNITFGYVEELTEVTEKSGKLKTINMGSYIIGALALISNKLKNNAQFDIAGFVAKEMARKFAMFLDKEINAGTQSKIENVFSAATNKITAATNEITADDIIDLQLKISSEAEKNAVWVMHKDTFAKVRKLKDTDGQYLLIKDFAAGGEYKLLGHNVYISENAPKPADSTRCILYGDFIDYALKFSKEMEIQVLSEVYAAKYATGVLGFAEVDGKIKRQSSFAVLELGAAA